MGLIHIYCGDGKGKTTAALGLALRAAGSGMNVSVIQLLKGADTGELHSIALIPNITSARCDKDYGFTYNMSEFKKNEIRERHNALLENAAMDMKNGLDMLIIDEFFPAYNYGLADRALADSIVFSKPEHTELILTGRNPDKKFIDAADYVSEIRAVKHPYTSGITARRGIEY